MARYLADTTILVDHLREREKAYNFLKANLPAISQVTLAELIEGSKSKDNLRAVNKAVSDLEVIAINENYSNLAINLMQKFFLSHRLEFLDALIAATAMGESLVLMTANTKHFSFIKGLKIEKWM